jgi:hypothetical protein
MTAISSNHISHDDQVKDAVTYLANDPTTLAAFAVQFPEWHTLVWEGAWLNAEASGVDVEYTSWVTEWIEANTDITWQDGEPVLLAPEIVGAEGKPVVRPGRHPFELAQHYRRLFADTALEEADQALAAAYPDGQRAYWYRRYVQGWTPEGTRPGGGMTEAEFTAFWDEEEGS